MLQNGLTTCYHHVKEMIKMLAHIDFILIIWFSVRIVHIHYADVIIIE